MALFQKRPLSECQVARGADKQDCRHYHQQKLLLQIQRCASPAIDNQLKQDKHETSQQSVDKRSLKKLPFSSASDYFPSQVLKSVRRARVIPSLKNHNAGERNRHQTSARPPNGTSERKNKHSNEKQKI
jgi:hypothetical protein